MIPALLKAPDLDCAAVQIEDKGTHGFRRYFITYARADGASPDVLERITQNRRGEIIDVYTSFEWPTLCRAVRCLKVNLERGTLLDWLLDKPLLRLEHHECGGPVEVDLRCSKCNESVDARTTRYRKASNKRKSSERR